MRGIRTLLANLSVLELACREIREIENEEKTHVSLSISSKYVENDGHSIGEDTIFTSSEHCVRNFIHAFVANHTLHCPYD